MKSRSSIQNKRQNPSQCNKSESQSSGNSRSESKLTPQARLNNMLLETQQLTKSQDYDSAILKLRLIIEKINYMRQNKRAYDKRLQLVCLYNLSAVFQKQWNLGECIPLLERFIDKLRSCMGRQSKMGGQIKQEGWEKNWFKMKTVMVKAMLQYCALLSQIGEHRKAIKIVIELTAEMKELFQTGYEACNKAILRKESQHIQSPHTAASKQAAIGKSPSILPPSSRDKIQFSLNVLLQARQLLSQLVGMQTYNDIVIDSSYPHIQNELQQIKSKIYYWKDNPENNIKTLRQSFGSEAQDGELGARKASERNLLGVKRSRSWIEQFTIAKIMLMTPMSYQQFSDGDNLIFEFNQRNLIEKIILLSVTYYSLSIELRFLQQEEGKDGIKVKGESLSRSEVFHLKSMEVICRYIKENCVFLNHLVLNYHKHYKKRLNSIPEESSMAEESGLADRKKQDANSLIGKEQKDNKGKEVMTPLYSKSSIYYDEDQVEAEPVAITEKKECKEGKSYTQNEINLHKEERHRQGGSKMAPFGKVELRIPISRSDKVLFSFKRQFIKQSGNKSLSKTKQLLKNSITLKQNKTSPQPHVRKVKLTNKLLKESFDFSKPDSNHKKSSSPTRALDLLKKSVSLTDHRKPSKQIRTIYASNGLPPKKG